MNTLNKALAKVATATSGINARDRLGILRFRLYQHGTLATANSLGLTAEAKELEEQAEAAYLLSVEDANVGTTSEQWPEDQQPKPLLITDDRLMSFWNQDHSVLAKLRNVSDFSILEERRRIYNAIRLLNKGHASDYEVKLLRLIAAHKL